MNAQIAHMVAIARIAVGDDVTKQRNYLAELCIALGQQVSAGFVRAGQAERTIFKAHPDPIVLEAERTPTHPGKGE